MQLWTGIFREVMGLCEAIAQLPEACECGDAEAHLAGRCGCCGHGRSGEAHGHGEDCQLLLDRLRADVAMLCQDFSQAAGPLEQAAQQAERIELRRGVFLAARDLQLVVEDLNEVGDAVIGFLRSCAITEMRRVKRHSGELREHCESLNAQLQGERP